MRITRAHNMTVPDAIVLVDTKLQEMLDEFGDGVSGVSREWQGSVLKFRFRANRIARFEGTLTVTDGYLELDLPFPLLARSKEGAARDEINRWLDRNLPRG